MKVAFVTPWPPQPTGIGDYSFDLISELVKYDLDISVYTDCEKPIQLSGIDIYHPENRNLDELNTYDLIIFQMGNNIHFHLYMFDLIKKYGGVVHLHDMVLHHLMGWLTWMQRDVASYLALIEKWYGEYVSLLCEELLKKQAMPWDLEVVTDLPLFEETLQYADACIVNSNFAENKISKAFPNLNIYNNILVQKDMNIVEKKYSDNISLNIGIFGEVEPYKAIDVILESLSNFKNYNLSWSAHIVGTISEKCKHIHVLPCKLGISENTFFYGRLEDSEFKNKMAEMDLIISLRYPTMGETSAVVTRAMQMGIPVIVSDSGWYKELPDFVDKVPSKNMKKELTEILKKYVSKKGYIKGQKVKYINHSKENLNIGNIIKKYHSILKEEASIKSNRVSYSCLAEPFDNLGVRDKFTIQNAATKLYNLFD